jgi:hypothetical protein
MNMLNRWNRSRRRSRRKVEALARILFFEISASRPDRGEFFGR